jgi:uncharacterized protein YbjT (DUF2867 family)
MRTLVTGASGFVGSLLTPRLQRQGHAVVALGRDPERVRSALAQAHPRAGAGDCAAGVEIVRGDALSGDGLAAALDGVEVAYYLIHSMEPTQNRNGFAQRDRVAAENFASAALDAGVRRIVYLGGIAPHWDELEATPPVSLHLASRHTVEQILLAAVPDSVALRASIVIGARSRSFRLLVHLVERMPVLALPAWRRFRTQPIDARDTIDMLVAAGAARLPKRSLDIGGPQALTYQEMLTRIAELMLVNRPAVGVGVNLTGLTGRLAAAIAGEDPELVLPLMEGLQGDILPADDRAAELLGVQLHTFDAAVEHALGEWEEHQPLAAR